MSSRPPPPPPTTGAASRTTVAAESPRSTASLETSDDQRRPCSPSAPPRTTADGAAELRLDPVGEVEQLLLVGELGAPAATTVDAADLARRRAASRSASSPSSCALRLLGALARLAQPLGRAAGAGQRVLRRAEQLADLAQLRLALAEPVDRGRAGERLDPAHVGGARALGDDLEDADLGRVGDVGAAAELARDAVDLDHPHPLAVFLAEQRHRAELLGLGPRPCSASAPARLALIHSLTRSSTSRSSSGLERLAVGEVEAQLVGADRGAGLAHVGAEPLAQRRVQEVGRGVVAHRRVAGLAVDHRPRPRSPGSIAAPLGSTSSAWSSPTR